MQHVQVPPSAEKLQQEIYRTLFEQGTYIVFDEKMVLDVTNVC